MAVAGGAVFGLVFGVWLVKLAVVLPAGGGFGASTIPLTGGAVEGVGRVLTGTEFVTGNVDGVGETLFGLPSTLFAGCGMVGGADGTWVVAVPGAPGCAAPVNGSSGSVSVAS